MADGVREAAVVVVSDSAFAGARVDATGPAVAACLRGAGMRVAEVAVVPDERAEIAARLTALSDRGVPLVVTAGGTGFGPRDITPEATRDVLEREAPGLAEEMRRAGLAGTRRALLSRGVCGVRAGTLLLNLPGSPRGAVDSLRAVLDVLPHALEVLTTPSHPHGDPPAPGA